jgi:hypothetical protein
MTALEEMEPAIESSDSRDVTDDAVARRAYEIYISGEGGDHLDNWLRAEEELRGTA